LGQVLLQVAGLDLVVDLVGQAANRRGRAGDVVGSLAQGGPVLPQYAARVNAQALDIARDARTARAGHPQIGGHFLRLPGQRNFLLLDAANQARQGLARARQVFRRAGQTLPRALQIALVLRTGDEPFQRFGDLVSRRQYFLTLGHGGVNVGRVAPYQALFAVGDRRAGLAGRRVHVDDGRRSQKASGDGEARSVRDFAVAVDAQFHPGRVGGRQGDAFDLTDLDARHLHGGAGRDAARVLEVHGKGVGFGRTVNAAQVQQQPDQGGDADEHDKGDLDVIACLSGQRGKLLKPRARANAN